MRKFYLFMMVLAFSIMGTAKEIISQNALQLINLESRVQVLE